MRVAFVALAVAACYRDAAPAMPSNKATVTDYSATAADVLGFLPLDSGIVFGLDAVRVRGSEVWKQLEPTVRHVLGADWTTIRDKCGFDPLDTITRITAGITSPDKNRMAGVIVVRGINAMHTLDCLQFVAADEGTATQDRGVLLTHNRRDDVASASIVVGGDTLVLQFGGNVTRATLDGVLASGSPLRGSPAFLAIYGGLEHDAAMFGIMNGSSKQFERMVGADLHPQSIDGTVTLSDRIVIAGRMTLESPDHATQLAAMAGAGISGARAMVERIDVTAAGAVVKLDLALTIAQLEQILGMIGIGP